MSIEARFQVKKNNFSLDVKLKLPARGVSAIFGPSGCGKTTLLRAIAGLERHPGGYLKFNDTCWQNDKFFLPTHQRPLGYVFQEASLFAHLDVKKNLEYGIKRIPENERKVALEEAIDLLGIAHLLPRKPHTLSGGEKQRVAIARALAVSPKLLLMDEPLAALDTKRKQEILPYLEKLHQSLEIPMIYVSHSTDEVARLADHLVLLEAGKVKASDDIDKMLTRLDLPLAHQPDAEAIINATVIEHDNKYALTYLEFDGGRFTVEQQKVNIGTTLRLRIMARDVSLTLKPQTETSILNIFPATITDFIPEGSSQMTVRLSLNNTPLLARITTKSAALLKLGIGQRVYAQIKTVALLA